MNTKLALIGLFAGISSAALGIGGGVILIPALIYICKIDIKKAIGASLATIVPTSAVASLSHYFINSDNIKFLFVLLVALGGIVGAKLGAQMVKIVKGNKILFSFGLLLLFVGFRYLGIIHFEEYVLTLSFFTYFLLILAGLLAGFGSSLFGIGGAVVIIPVITLLYGLNMHEAVATSISIIFPMSLAGVIFHAKNKNVPFNLVKILILFSMLGSVLGAFATNAIDSELLKKIFGIFMVLISIKIVFESTVQGKLSKGHNIK